YFGRACALQQEVQGKENADYAASLTGLGNVYWRTGRYEQAEPLYREAKDIRERVLGRDHPAFANALNNLANLYRDLGQHENAEPLYLQSRDLREELLGREHPEYAASLHNLASLYHDMGLYQQAEELYQESITLTRQIFGEDHSEYALSLENLAFLYDDLEQFEKSERLHLESLAIQESAIGKQHPEYIGTLHNLAELYRRTSRELEAKDHYHQLLTLLEEVVGKEHPDYASALNNLGILHWYATDFKKAESLYRECLDIRRKVLGSDHPDYVYSLGNLAETAEAQQRFDEADRLLAEAAGLQQERLAKGLSFLSESELAEYARQIEHAGIKMQNQLFRRVTAHQSPGQLSGLSYDNALFYKGYLLSAAIRLNTLAATDPQAAEWHSRLKAYRRQLAGEYAWPLQERDSARIAELEALANQAEKALAQQVAEYGQAMRQVDWHMIQEQLQPGAAAVEFVRFELNFPRPTDSVLYAALVLRPGDPQPQVVPLFEEKQLSRVPDARLAYRLPGRSDPTLAMRGVQPVRKDTYVDLYRLIWQPLDDLLAGTTTVYYAPAGLLHRISLDAIPLDSVRCLADRYRLVRLGSTRALAIPDAATDFSPGVPAALFGGITYDGVPTAETVLDIPADQPSRSRSWGGENWPYLPGTASEVQGIAPVLQQNGFTVQVYAGSDAHEAKLKSFSAEQTAPAVLHLATHGFFLPAGSAGVPTNQPLMRSGLLLAGANEAWKSGKPAPGTTEDGILTAYEIAQMNLKNTGLVVLSACETGLGDIAGSEGVYGLQRAFKIAGARYLIMSLWKVPDEQTALLMTRFYENWLERDMPVPDAFRAAQRELRVAGLSAEEWAGFVLLE
ncbi:MAG: tetratricopeptide repeat protein, partial [Bacteroidetes bacterium]